MSLIEKQKYDRKVMYEQERSNEMYVNKLANDKEEYRKKVIQEARKRLLQEHAAKLAGYVPNKAFANQDEYEIFQKSSFGQY
jgi:Fe-S cluster biosynthesis and repair protein YggX